MAAKARFEPVHINASFMKEHGRASDHDPVLVQIDFSGAQTQERRQMINKEIQDNQRIKPALLHRIQDLNLSLIRPKPMNKRVQHLKAKRRARTKMRSKTTRKRRTTETKTPGKRKILPSTGQETSYLALLEWQ